MIARRMSAAARMVAEFHHASGEPSGLIMDPHPVRVGRGLVAHFTDTAELHDLRSRLIGEEACEAMDAIVGWDRRANERADRVSRAHIGKELADLLYVTYGAADVWSIPLDDVFVRVHRNNMTKVRGPRRVDGKIMKPPGYRAVDLTDLIPD